MTHNALQRSEESSQHPEMTLFPETGIPATQLADGQLADTAHKRRKNNSMTNKRHSGPQNLPELQFRIAITCFLDWHDDSCMLDLKLQNLTRRPMVLYLN